jgi:hypothetical protein
MYLKTNGVYSAFDNIELLLNSLMTIKQARHIEELETLFGT